MTSGTSPFVVGTEVAPSGIAHDIAVALSSLLRRLLSNGIGFSEALSVANLAAVDYKVAENTDVLFPALSIYNNTNATILFGWNRAVIHLPVGMSYTFRWKNPRAGGGIVVNANGATAGTIDVVS